MQGRKNLQAFFVGLAVLIIGTIFFIYWGNRKQIWFCDEIYSYESSNGFEQAWPATNQNQWMTGADVEAFFSADIDTLSLNDITVRLYCDHVPLYFWLFRIVSFFVFKGSGTIWIGLSINLFFYLIVLVTGYLGFLRLTDNPLISGAATVLTCVVNRLMLQQATTLRMYMMLLWAEIFLLLAALWILHRAAENKGAPGAFVLLAAVSIIGFLTHYDFWIFYAITATVFCLWLLFSAVRKRGRKFYASREFCYVLAWVGNFIVSLLATIALFPYCQWNLNRGKGQLALNSVFVFSKEKLQHIIWGYQRLSASIFGEIFPTGVGLGLMFACIVGGAIVLIRKKEIKKLTGLFLTVVAAQAYQLVVCFTLPEAEEERYLWGTFTIMLLCMAWCCIVLWRQVIRWPVGVAIILCLLVGEFAVIDGGRGIAYLYQEEKDVALLKEHSDIPWIVYGPIGGDYSYYDWIIPEEICFLTQDGAPEEAAAVQKLKEYDCFVLYTFEEFYPQALEFFEQELGLEVSAQYLTKSTKLTVYLVNIGHR